MYNQLFDHLIFMKLWIQLIERHIMNLLEKKFLQKTFLNGLIKIKNKPLQTIKPKTVKYINGIILN